MAVVWDGVKRVEIRMRKERTGELCGICGNFDGVHNEDDYMMGFNTERENICPNKAVPDSSKGMNVSASHTVLYSVYALFLVTAILNERPNRPQSSA